MLSIVKHKLTAPIISLTLSCTIFYLLFLGVHADEISYSDVIEERSTNWSDTLSVPQFDPNLGELQEVQIQLEGSVNGVVLYENLGPLAAPITMTHSATISVDLPNSVLIASAPSAVFTDTVSAFDGIRDNDGA
ncbi:choice-of-anchor E domain-containing protein, partial [Chloroflexi bacterium TSY]|nr:choice-of-anchor E domain-containing protein [Chloroflexi bacterium TSY]